jgi:hypothetical protein
MPTAPWSRGGTSARSSCPEAAAGGLMAGPGGEPASRESFHEFAEDDELLDVLGAFAQGGGPGVQGVFVDRVVADDRGRAEEVRRPGGGGAGRIHRQVFRRAEASARKFPRCPSRRRPSRPSAARLRSGRASRRFRRPWPGTPRSAGRRSCAVRPGSRPVRTPRPRCPGRAPPSAPGCG